PELAAAKRSTIESTAAKIQLAEISLRQIRSRQITARERGADRGQLAGLAADVPLLHSLGNVAQLGEKLLAQPLLSLLFRLPLPSRGVCSRYREAEVLTPGGDGQRRQFSGPRRFVVLNLNGCHLQFATGPLVSETDHGLAEGGSFIDSPTI